MTVKIISAKGFIALMMGVLLSAFFLIYIKDYNRRLFIHYQQLMQQRQQLNIAWGRLLLEQGTLTTAPRIQSIAQKQLHMHVPSTQEITMVKDQ